MSLEKESAPLASEFVKLTGFEALSAVFWGFWVFLVLFGACLGSFLACLTSRLVHEKPLLKARSFCFVCGTNLAFKELVPVISFIFLRGKCKNCGAFFSRESLVFELLTPLILIFSFMLATNFYDFLFLSAFLCLLLMLSAMDVRFFAVNEALLWLSLIFAFFYALNLTSPFSSKHLLNTFLQAFALMGGVFFLQSAVSFFISLKARFKSVNLNENAPQESHTQKSPVQKNLAQENLTQEILTHKSLECKNQGIKEPLNNEISSSMGEADILIIGAMGAILGFYHAFLMLFLASFFALIFAFFSFLKHKKKPVKIAMLPFLSLGFVMSLALFKMGFGAHL